MDYTVRNRYATEFELHTRVIEQKVLRRKLIKYNSLDPILFLQYVQEKMVQEKRLPKSETINIIIEKFCQQLRFKKRKYEHFPRKMELGFYSKSGYEVFKYNKAGWISLIPNCNRSHGIDFKPETCEELIEKLIRFRIIERL